MSISVEDLRDLRELLEDSMEFYCDGRLVSGETAWTVVEAIAQAKLAQLHGEVT